MHARHAFELTEPGGGGGTAILSAVVEGVPLTVRFLISTAAVYIRARKSMAGSFSACCAHFVSPSEAPHAARIRERFRKSGT